MNKFVKFITTLLVAIVVCSNIYSQSSTRVKGNLELPGNIKFTDASYNPITTIGNSYVEITRADMLRGGDFLLLTSPNPVVITDVSIKYNYIPPVYVTTGSADTMFIKGNVGNGEKWYGYVKDSLFKQSSSKIIFNVIDVTEVYNSTEYKYWLEIPVNKYTVGKSTWVLYFSYKYLNR